MSAKANVNAIPAEHIGRTALQAVKRLLSARADVNADPAEHDGRLALQAVEEKRHLAIVGRLLAAKADADIVRADCDQPGKGCKSILGRYAGSLDFMRLYHNSQYS